MSRRRHPSKDIELVLVDAEALALPPDSELVGESTRRAELVPA